MPKLCQYSLLYALLSLILFGNSLSFSWGQDASTEEATPEQTAHVREKAQEIYARLDKNNPESVELTLSRLEQLYERFPANQEARCELREKFAQLRPLAAHNENPENAGVWKVAAFIIRSTDFSWEQNGEQKEFQASFTEAEIERIKRGMEGFANFVWDFSDGWLRIEWTCEVVEKSLTKFDAIGETYWSGPVGMGDVLPEIPMNSTDSIMTFVKTGGVHTPEEKTDAIPLYSFGAALPEWNPYTHGATYITFHWETNSAITEPDGEPMMHEWCHSLQWALENRRHYPLGLAGNPDGGRFVGEERSPEEADPCYHRDPAKEKSWIELYRHILQTHTTRNMLKGAAERDDFRK